MNSFVDKTSPRMQAIINTDKLVYRGNDTIFIEVLLIDTLRNGPVTFPNNSQNPSDAVVTVSLGIANVWGTPLYDIDFDITNVTGPAGSVAFKLDEDVTAGDYAIRVAGQEFAYASKIIQVRATSSNEAPGDNGDGSNYPTYNITFELIDYQPPTKNSSIWGKITVFSPEGGEMPKNVTVNGRYGDDWENIDVQVYDLSSDGSCYFSVDTDSIYFTDGDYITIYATVVDADDNTYYSDDFFVSLGGQPPIDDNNDNGDYDLLDPTAIRVYFQHESLSDIVVNVTQKIYFYSYIADYEGDVSINDNFFQFGRGQIKAFNQTFMNLPPVFITNVTQALNGFGSFVFTPKELLTYFLEIQVGDLIQAPQEDYADFKRDNITMDGPSIFMNGTIRIPLIVEGYQTRRQRSERQIDEQKHPENYEPTFNMDVLDDFEFDYNDQETGFNFAAKNDIFTVGYEGLPPLLIFDSFPNPANFSNTLGFFYRYAQGFVPDEDGSLSQDATIETITFNAAQVVAKFVEYTIQALNEIDPVNTALLQLVEGDSEANQAILAPLFPGSGRVTANIFGTYGPDWLKSKCGSNNTQQAPQNITKPQLGAEVSVSVLNSAKTMAFTRTLANNEDLNIQFNTNNFLDVNDYYLLTIRQRDRIIYNETLKLNKTNQVKTIKASSFNLPLGGILTVNLYKITEAYFLFQNTTNGTICDQSMVQQLLSDGTLVIQSNGQVTYNDQDVTYYQDDLSQSVLNSSNLSANSSIQLPYTPIDSQNCILLDLDQVVSYLEQRASINFFKRPSTNVSVEVTTAKNNYMQGEQVNATITVRNKATGAIITDPGYLYVSATEDAQLAENETADLPTQVYLLNDIDERQLSFLNPGKILGQYFGNNGTSSNDSSLEFLMVAQQLRYYIFEMEYYQYVSRDLDFGMGGSLVASDIISQSQLYGLNLMKDLPQEEQLADFKQTEESYWSSNYNTPSSNAEYTPYRRSYSPADYMIQQTGIMTGSNWTHNTYANYNRSAYLDWTETLFWGSGIKTQGGKANITFKTSDLSSNFRIQANFYGVATAYKRFSVGKAFKFTFLMPKRMAVGDSYNATLIFENFSPNHLTIRPFPLLVDYALQIKAANGTDITQLAFLAPANFTSSFNVVVIPLKATKSARIVLSARANDATSKYEEFDQQVTKVFNLALSRSSFYAGTVSCNTSDTAASTVNLAVSFPDSSTFNTTRGSLYFTTSMFGNLVYILDLLEQQDPETSDDCVSRIDIYQQVIESMRTLANQMDNYTQIVGIVKELQFRQNKIIKKLNNYLVFSGTASNPTYNGFDNFPSDNAPSTKTGSIASTALSVFVTKVNPELRDREGVNKTYDLHLRYLLTRKASKYGQATTDSDANTKINSLTLQAFTLFCLANAKYSNGTAINQSDDIFALVKAVNSTFNATQNVWASQTSDAYQLALTILAVVTSNPASINATVQAAIINFIAPQLIKHFNQTTGAFDVSPKTVNTTSSPMNSMDNDRVVEQTALAILALGNVNPTLYMGQILKAGQFLRSQNPANMVGNSYAIMIYSRALSLLDSTSAFTSTDSATITLSFNGTQVAQDDIMTQYGMSSFDLDITDPIYQAGKNGTFQIQVTNPSSPSRKIYYFALWSYQDNNYAGVPPKANDLNITVTANYTQVLLRDKKAGNTTAYGYTITAVNNDPYRGSSAVVVTVRLPACLQADSGLIKNSYNANKNVIGDINNDDDQNLVQINVKPIASKGTTSFTFGARQVGQGICRMGYVSFKNKNSPTEYSVRPAGI